MTHWGWYWKVKKQHKPKRLCSAVPLVDAFSVVKQMDTSETSPASCLMNCNDITERVRVEKQACYLGGFRYFFLCPGCNKRMRFLYFLEGFRCRQCLKLGYHTQRLTPSNRNLVMSDKIECHIKRRGGTLTQRPLGMHNSTWEHLRSKYREYEIKYERTLIDELISYYPTLGPQISQLI